MKTLSGLLNQHESRQDALLQKGGNLWAYKSEAGALWPDQVEPASQAAIRFIGYQHLESAPYFQPFLGITALPVERLGLKKPMSILLHSMRRNFSQVKPEMLVLIFTCPANGSYT